MNRRRVLTSAVAFAASLGGGRAAPAQPGAAQLMRMLVPLAPGGAVDPYARVIAEHMARTLGRTIIVDYKPGASGNVGTQYAAHEPADGNLILVTTQSLTEINPSSFGDTRWTLDQFIPLIRGVEAPLVLAAYPGVPAQSLDELVAWARQNRGKLSYSSYSAGTPSHFLGDQLTRRFGLDLVHVPSKGSGFQATELMAGHVPFGFAQMQSTLALVRDGKLKAIAVTSEKRSRFLPEVASFAELGHGEFTARVWFGLMLRAGTPPAVVATLLSAAKAAHADREVTAKLEALTFDVSGQSGPDFVADIKAQAVRWAALVKAAGFKAGGG